MSVEAADGVVDAFDVLVLHCLNCHTCRADPNQMCPDARPLHDIWKALWRKDLRGDLRKV
ncbi:hypothetical protein HLK59_45060 [Streptomyces sp. S3(2020)]|uniref:hypothetical protein n=1 Tax=Streptomyces sp. S3(2020) TaxID=2732044 RepID=UPI001488C31A|nr:hypothetical protein [Streptomyces sp. S3(2020)]NNN37386.1 hypothetical protein [Streptomyces sp. S3(2020)]